MRGIFVTIGISDWFHDSSALWGEICSLSLNYWNYKMKTLVSSWTCFYHNHHLEDIEAQDFKICISCVWLSEQCGWFWTSALGLIRLGRYNFFMVARGSGGRVDRPLTGRLVVWSLAPPFHVPKCPWTRYWTLNCPWQLCWQWCVIEEVMNIWSLRGKLCCSRIQYNWSNWWPILQT